MLLSPVTQTKRSDFTSSKDIDKQCHGTADCTLANRSSLLNKVTAEVKGTFVHRISLMFGQSG